MAGERTELSRVTGNQQTGSLTTSLKVALLLLRKPAGTFSEWCLPKSVHAALRERSNNGRIGGSLPFSGHSAAAAINRKRYEASLKLSWSGKGSILVPDSLMLQFERAANSKQVRAQSITLYSSPVAPADLHKLSISGTQKDKQGGRDRHEPKPHIHRGRLDPH